jgi:hypothetical protein
MPTKLFRPVGLTELALLWDAGMKGFPPRLVQQPIFYPVLNLEYARQIAHDWNPPDKASGFAGFVTQFEVSSTYLSKYEIHTAGSMQHREYWIPAREMNALNKAISGLISVDEGFFGIEFTGYVPDDHRLKGLNAKEQFAALSAILDFSEFQAEISANRKAVFLNCLFWLKTILFVPGYDRVQREIFITRLLKAWHQSKADVPLPIRLNQE